MMTPEQADKLGEQVSKYAEEIPDALMWSLVTMAVAIAGQRAEDSELTEVENACIVFLEAMHKAVGTPPVVYGPMQ
jgi:hypothetical protein